MADLRDFTGKNRTHTGTTGITVSDNDATTAQRVNEKGRLRYNNTLGLMEYYNGTTWIAIDAPPSVTSVNPSSPQINDGDTSVSFAVLGSNFSVGASVKIVNTNGTEFSPSSTTRDSETQLSVTFSVSGLGTIADPYDVKVTNASGLANTLAQAFSFNESPVWSTSAGSLGSIFNNATGNHFTLSATDPEGGDVDYHVSAGSLPPGLSLDGETGIISGDPDDVGSATTTNFSVTAYDSASTAVSRDFSITVNPLPTGGSVTTYSNYRVHSFTSSSNFVTGAQITNADILVVGGGGAGGAQGTSETGGGGGAGGFRTSTGVTIPAATHAVTVGTGGNGVGGTGGDGGTSSFGTLLVTSGGGGGGQQNAAGRSGGSGGGGGGIDSGEPGTSGGSGNSGGYSPSEGNPGGAVNSGVGDMGAGGGGASNSGESVNSGPRGGGNGGNGATNAFQTGSNITYAGGGGGGMNTNTTRGSGGSGGGGQGNPGPAGSGTDATDGLGGGGGGGNGPGTRGGHGGDGIVVVRFEL